MKTKLLFKLGLIATLLFSTTIFAQWSSNSAINNSICTAPFLQYQQVAISDGSGGAIITWADKRSGTGVGAEQEFTDIYAQRINSAGVSQWLANGVPICTVAGRQHLPVIISDNNGGAIITWSDERNSSTNLSDIFAQHISSSGTILWALNGVSICSKVDDQNNVSTTSDGNGGAIITWEDRRNGLDYNIFAQSINSSGVTQWNLDGTLVCNATNNQKNPEIIAAETGQAIITWVDKRVSTSSSQIYALKINNGGVNAWGGTTTNGVLICAAVSCLEPKLVSDGNFGAIITWYDRRNGVDYNIYAQKIIADGTIPWLSLGGLGIEICTEVGNQVLPQICSDGANGAFIAWGDSRQGNTSSDVYFQHITNDSQFVIPWTINGSSIVSVTGSQNAPALIADGFGGAILSWNDYRNGSSADIYTQRVNATGFALWDNTLTGVPVCTEASDQSFATTIVQGNSGEAIIVWKDDRNGNSDIFAQKVNAQGTLANKTVAVENQFFTLYPNPTANANFSIQSLNSILDVTAYDILGKQIAIEKNNDSYKINASTGIYTIKISDDNGNSQIKKLILN